MFFITWCCNLERMSEFPEAQNQRVKKIMYLRRALDSAQFIIL